ncbi:MAG: hypothetical protein ACI4XL_08365 [Bacillus sp. (in: firmicutes)]
MYRSFQFDGKWNIIHYPQRPNGFSVFIIGDSHHYVDDKGSYWLQHPGRSQHLQKLLEQGYTVFSSHITCTQDNYENSMAYMKNLHHMIMKKEILNEQMHVLAEGKGAMYALMLLKGLPTTVRSLVLLNPCLDPDHMRILNDRREKATAHTRKTGNKVVVPTKQKQSSKFRLHTPIRILEIIGESSTGYFLYKKIQRQNRMKTERICLPPNKRYKIPAETVRFFAKQENVL